MGSDTAGRSSGRRFLRLVLVSAALLVAGGLAAMLAVYFAFLRDLPDLRTIADYRPPLASVVVDRHGQEIGEFFVERRRLTPMDQIPRHVVLAFVAGEDNAFFQHGGIDFQSILRAAWANLLAGEKVEGASTITQQTVKGLLLSPERTYRRKIREMILARRIEQHFSKDEILYLYLNQIYFGHGAYGIGDAARTYFGKDVSLLSVSEGALLAGLPKAPSRYSPFSNPARAEQRRRYVIERMHDEGFIDDDAFQTALATPPVLAAGTWQKDYADAAYFDEEVRRHLFEVLGGDAVLSGGLRIETTLDADLQHAAVTSLRDGLEALDRRQGYRGPLRKIEPAKIKESLTALAEENGLALPARAKETPEGAEGADTAAAEPSAEAPPADAVQVPLRLALDAKLDAAARVRARFDAQGPLTGVVLSVDDKAGVAKVAFAPDVEAEVHLEDIEWARPANRDREPYDISRIGEALRRGDVTRFAPLPLEEAKPGEDGKKPAPTPPAGAPLRVRLAQTPSVQGALLSFDTRGDVLAFVGGYDFEKSEFNRVTQARRQPGSAFKPIIYGAALAQEDAEGHKRYTPASIIYDRPAVYTDQYTGLVWKPKNYGREFYGPITFRKALAKSINTAAVHLCDEVGMGEVIRYARNLGIESPIEPTLATALGTSGLSLLELTRGYGVFAAGGRRLVPRYIRKVTDRDGNVLLERVALGTDFEAMPPTPERAEGDAEGNGQPPSDPMRVIPAGDAYLMVDLLRAVVLEGTGQKLRDLGKPVAGKTGTTNDQADAWFVGFSPDVVTGVWVGHDVAKFLGPGETGAKAAAPIWEDYMRVALAGRPERDFSPPDSIVFARIDRDSGLLATHDGKDTVFQSFLAGTEPTVTVDAQRNTSEALQEMREDSLSGETDAEAVRLMQLDNF
ncbi:MAG TPA: PBP1A family penicillin-binding protein [Myxococcota bacterium]|nr:PBP1A family penicillin-binding protein [Myxococcota bacterium]